MISCLLSSNIYGYILNTFIRTDQVAIIKRFKSKNWICLCQQSRGQTVQNSRVALLQTVRKQARVHTVVLSRQVWFVCDDGCNFVPRCWRETNSSVSCVYITELPARSPYLSFSSRGNRTGKLMGQHDCSTSSQPCWTVVDLSTSDFARPTAQHLLVCVTYVPILLSRSPALWQLLGKMTAAGKTSRKPLDLPRSKKRQPRWFHSIYPPPALTQNFSDWARTSMCTLAFFLWVGGGPDSHNDIDTDKLQL